MFSRYQGIVTIGPIGDSKLKDSSLQNETTDFRLYDVALALDHM